MLIAQPRPQERANPDACVDPCKRRVPGGTTLLIIAHCRTHQPHANSGMFDVSGPNALNIPFASESRTVLPFPVGIAATIDPASTPPSNDSPVKAKFKALVLTTRTPDSKVVNVAVPTSMARKPENAQRPAVAARVPSHASDVAPPVSNPIPVGANSPGTALFVSASFRAKLDQSRPCKRTECALECRCWQDR